MAEQEPYSLASTFPNPPPFWKDFTPDRVARIEELRSAFAGGASEQASSPVVRIPGLPEELANLQAPPEPPDGRWRVFGDQYMVHASPSPSFTSPFAALTSCSSTTNYPPSKSKASPTSPPQASPTPKTQNTTTAHSSSKSS